MSWVLYEFSRPKINAILRAAWVCDKILICDYSNETSSALFIGDWLLEKWKLKSMLASESWFPVDEKKDVVTIGLNKPKGFWKSSSSSSSLLINYLSMNSPTIILLSSTIYGSFISIPLYRNGRLLCAV